MSKAVPAFRELQLLLRAGYKLQKENGVKHVHRVPRSWEPGFTKNSFRDYLRFGANGRIDYDTYTNSIEQTFSGLGLDFSKFDSRSDSINSAIDPDNPAGLLVRQLREIENIIIDKKLLESYVLPEIHEKVEFTNGVIIQGFARHPFREKEYIELLNLLWGRRRIVSPKGEIFKEEVPTEKAEIYKKLGINHDRFTDIVRGIKAPMNRKSIDLTIKFPRKVVLIVTQDYV